MTQDASSYKEMAAMAAVEFLESGMVVGLGHGSTVQFALAAISKKIKSGELSDILGIPCSTQTEATASELGIPLGDLNDHSRIDITIDGADEVDPQLNLIKGGGGALLREKIVAQASKREIIIIDEGKLSPVLGTNFPVPVEVTAFGWTGQLEFLSSLGSSPELRRNETGEPTLTDQGNYLIDCHFDSIPNPEDLARSLESRSGILEHGLFLGLANDVIVAGPSGIQHHREKK